MRYLTTHTVQMRNHSLVCVLEAAVFDCEIRSRDSCMKLTQHTQHKCCEKLSPSPCRRVVMTNYLCMHICTYVDREIILEPNHVTSIKTIEWTWCKHLTWKKKHEVCHRTWICCNSKHEIKIVFDLILIRFVMGLYWPPFFPFDISEG